MTQDPIFLTQEGQRLLAARHDPAWRRWGPYLSERQWGTVREDYSADGTAWDYLPHDHARSRAYRWGEDGLAGFADSQLLWCLSLALWNGHDPILKERIFGLTNGEGNHGEDVKELYYFLDGTPTHSFMRMLYKYPQAAFPYERLVQENRHRGPADREFELVDTGVFDEGRYFDVFVEYAKASADDLLLEVTAWNRGPEPATLHLLPQLWARNTWSWDTETARPSLRLEHGAIHARHPALAGTRVFEVDGTGEWIICENETNFARLFGAPEMRPAKDGINDAVILGRRHGLSDNGQGTKCAALHTFVIPAGGKATLRARFRSAEDQPGFADFATILAQRKAEADQFYAALQRDVADADARHVQRQALAGLLWSKQAYCFDVLRWQDGDPAQPPPAPQRPHGRNAAWRHLNAADVLMMPDTWEYPWFAAWDLAFHCLALAPIDPDFAKQQLLQLLNDRYAHPSGQLPAYEWAFGDVNPPVQAWAALRLYRMDEVLTGQADRAFLERCFHRLAFNFAWWVNRKDADGRNVFGGGFLGLDNISVFDRSAMYPGGGSVDQADGTAWMAMFALNLMRIALTLAEAEPVYESMALKFFQHFLLIADAMTRTGGIGLWNNEDEFFYDVLRLPDGNAIPLRVRTIVGLIPLLAVEVIDSDTVARLPEFHAGLKAMLARCPDLAALISHWSVPGKADRRLLSLLRGHRMKRLLARMLDPAEFLSPNGLRALSRVHRERPFELDAGGMRLSVGYDPGEGRSSAFGGNSNWRGPVWMPINLLLIDALREFHRYYGNDFRVPYPAGSDEMLPLDTIADRLSQSLGRLFLRDADGRRAIWGDSALLQNDSEFRDHLFFYEYFHGDDGRGLGASHQTGWTACIALLLAGREGPWQRLWREAAP
jgi:hypothetical protein